MKKPSVSMIVPCYNYGRYVAQAIDSILSQTIVDLEIIVIDDASSDETQEVLKRFHDEARVRIIRHEVNIGHIRSYNEGLELARGAYVGILSADDYCLASNVVAAQVRLFEADPNVGMVYAAHILVSPWEEKVIRPWPETCLRKGSEELEHLIWGNYVPHSGTLVRADVQREIGPYDLDLPHTADWFLWLRVALKYDIGYLAEPAYAYRIHGENMRHKQISATRAADESLDVLERTYGLAKALPGKMDPWRARTLDHALLQNAWFDLSFGHRTRVWRAGAHAVAKRPRVLMNGEFWKLLTASAGPRRTSGS